MSFRVGVAKETRPLQGRVALTPSAVAERVGRGVEIGIERAAGMRSRYAEDA